MTGGCPPAHEPQDQSCASRRPCCVETFGVRGLDREQGDPTVGRRRLLTRQTKALCRPIERQSASGSGKPLLVQR
ncbi:hypothetical protein GUY61_04625 [Streptomyces sp. GC420]|nr:hypothetical protein [Streptomyces sp. GC420]